jgi:hypothetical protein
MSTIEFCDYGSANVGLYLGAFYREIAGNIISKMEITIGTVHIPKTKYNFHFHFIAPGILVIIEFN